jgi:hypothetical protein
VAQIATEVERLSFDPLNIRVDRLRLFDIMRQHTILHVVAPRRAGAGAHSYSAGNATGGSELPPSSRKVRNSQVAAAPGKSGVDQIRPRPRMAVGTLTGGR